MPCEHVERRKGERRDGAGLVVIGRVIGGSCARGCFDTVFAEEAGVRVLEVDKHV